VKAYMGAWGIGTPEFKRELGPMSEYVYGAGNWETGTAPKEARAEESQIIASYKAKYKESPSSLAMLAYLSTKYLLEAVVKGGGASGAYNSGKTRAALRALDVVGPVGRVAFDDKGDPKYFTSVLFQLQKGNQVVVYPTERASGKAQYPAVPWGGK
jgi:branched-chain amino acid transport system substrate-binding protein